jgi:hypothetical protein
MAREPRDPVGSRIGPEIGVERAVLLHDDHDVLDLVDPLADSRIRVASMAREVGRPEQQAQEEDAREDEEEEPLQRVPRLRGLFESGVRRV